MREILFRGKRYDDGNWVEGYLIHDEVCNPHIPYIGYLFDVDDVDLAEAILGTVGQFTGLTDKNGKKIFEGDIVHILGNQDVEDWKNVDYIALIAFLDGGFCAIDGTVEEHGFRRYALSRLDFSLEVIGNIHDNPELLEVQDG